MESSGADPVNGHAAWRLAVAERVAAAYAGNAGVAALTVAGSVGAGLADRFSDLELDCYWTRPPTDRERLAPVEAIGGDLEALWDYDSGDAEWSEDYRVGELDITVSNFLAGTVDQFLDDVLLEASTDPVRHMRLAAVQRCRPLIGAALVESWRVRAAQFPDRLVAALALNHVYLPHRQLKWQRQLTAGLALAPSQFTERVALISAGPPEQALRTAEALLAETADLAEAHSGASLGEFRATLRERRRSIDPPPDHP